MVASCTPCDGSATVSFSGQRVAATRRRRSTKSSSGTWIWKERMVGSVMVVMLLSLCWIHGAQCPARGRPSSSCRTCVHGRGLADRGDRVQDDLRDSLGPRDHDHVRALGLGDGGPGALGHRANNIRTGGLVACCD